MRITRIVAAVMAAALSTTLTACSLTVNAGDGHDGMGAADMMSSADDVDRDLNMSDVMFVQMMIPHHEQAVEMAALAPAAGASPEVQDLASAIAAAQGPEIAQMEAMLDRWDVQPMMDHSGHQMAGMVSDADMEALADATGAEFDRLFLQAMIAHHQGAIDMTVDPLANGEDPELRTLLEAIVTTQTAEIAEMEQLLAAR
jgi:uncharacterized protein (DUF305 family)